ncbi:DM4_12 [Nesidiocoris tenuis]|uniref:DM4_12 n=1 Tax=Nesidiocoris tenuis TaxID=355587 RepID=A0ABN7B212_9HEMI|nr:DM4_12 [Nesidiocoris tenuis]
MLKFMQIALMINSMNTFCNGSFNRRERTLPFPRGIGNKLQVITGFGIPVPDIKTDVTYGLIIKSNYELPTNSVQFTQPELAFGDGGDRRGGMKISRVTLYNLLKYAMDKLQIRGDSCIFLTICQASFTIFEQQGLLGEIMKVLFLPSSTPGEFSLVLDEFRNAEKIGEDAEDESDCRAAYPSCDKSLIEMMTVLADNRFIKILLDTV